MKTERNERSIFRFFPRLYYERSNFFTIELSYRLLPGEKITGDKLRFLLEEAQDRFPMNATEIKKIEIRHFKNPPCFGVVFSLFLFNNTNFFHFLDIYPERKDEKLWEVFS
jgi:hypothetical protein